MLLLHLKNQRIKTKLFTLKGKEKEATNFRGLTVGIKIVTAKDMTP